MLQFLKHQPRAETRSETKYKTNDGLGPVHELPKRLRSRDCSPQTDSNLELSVVVPAYNEKARLGKMLDEAVVFLEQHYQGKYEIVISDDASHDGTGDFALGEATRLRLAPHVLKVVTLVENRGKGGAVAHGILHGGGKYLLFADADGATKFSDVTKLLAHMEGQDKGPAVAIGSRAHMINSDAVVKRSFIRNLMMYALHTLVFVFGIRDIQDTQCGFKMFNRESALMILPHMHTERWIFDVEILLLAELQKIPIVEIPVNWQEVDGSKVDLAKDSIQMAVDLVVTRMAYMIGIYGIDECGHLRR
ncbi:hypothetical protein METBIDRAFT_78739 [Metschnikowia bicuspidata var. bicuspidata NRRL YB-4993]|uniref:dolichyl-phosphate beta-glucosyltransferase n=1 Tax=Metschnikowia bicuspidata var. bicuspidata NRRL YB-4993 TaxID=869754 RepID=A0A1A0H884_9ASCO|nr:hypothetical protein METBIDRAFT_78739 [Metschnikowia bicuspidata var. bicuspidata NRRL YB-4993]OBA20319.1 hypothetical protein METBIDRAFT_78739 [Metschnikowia bicuspidata var. bicuspidata NRRL YB-4993]